jgi:hypothetical protein
VGIVLVALVSGLVRHIYLKRHEAWLRTPEGLAWQEGERKQQQEAERRRREAEVLAARERWEREYAYKTLDEIGTMTSEGPRKHGFSTIRERDPTRHVECGRVRNRERAGHEMARCR